MRLRQGFLLIAALSALTATTGCSDDESGGSGAGGAGGTSASTSTTTASSGPGAGGGPQAPDFIFTIVPAAIDVPYGGAVPVDLKVQRVGGFDAAIEVIVNAPPPGLVTMPLTIPGDATTAVLQVGASGELRVGTTFNLELAAVSREASRFAAVFATVVAIPYRAPIEHRSR
jgi:hypothetical protein